MTNILIFSTAYFPFVGGAEIAVKEITDRIGNMRFDMITARMDRKLPREEKIGNVNVYRIGFGLHFFDKIILAKFGWLKALQLNKKNNYDFAWSIMASQASISASIFKKITNKKLILTLQEGDEEDHLKRYVFNIEWLYKILIRPWHLLVFKKADVITAISEYLKKRAVANGVRSEIKIIPNGVDIDQFSIFNFQFSINDFRNKLGIRENDRVLITTSRLVKKNAVGDVIMAMLKFKISNLKFLILGTGPDENKLKNLVKELKVEDKVLFLGHVNNEEIPKYLKISDIFVRPSLSEGLGNSFLEAMAAGIPVIATPVGGIPDFLKPNETGLFCEVNNPESIVEKVNIYLENNELREKIIVNAGNMVREKYNWDNIARDMKNVFNN